MAYVRPTLVQGTATAIGTSNPSITDQVGQVSWSTVPDGSTVHYAIQNNPVTNVFEWGLGTKTTSGGLPVLTRTAANVIGGSAGVGVLTNFLAGTQIIYAAPLGEIEV